MIVKEGQTPEDAAQKYFAALKENRIDDFAKSMHPDALKEFKQVLAAVLDAAAKQGQEKQLLGLFGAKSVDEVKKLDDQQFFAMFYRAVTKARPELKEALGGSSVQTLGHVIEGKDKAHVVCRLTLDINGAKVTKMNVVSLQKTQTGWGMLLSAEIEGIAIALKKRFGN